MRYFTILTFLALVIIMGFFAGHEFGLFLFSSETQTSKTRINANEYADKRGYEVASPLVRNDDRSTDKREYNCSDEIEFLNEDDEKFCFQKPKLVEFRGIEVDLTNNKALIYDQGKLIKVFPLSYQSPENKWYQAPTGYYRVGVKREKHLSSLFPVIMPYAIQFYEDFFIHGIPYYKNGESVSSDFTGGCLRFANDVAKEIYDFLKTGDQILVYKTFDDLKLKEKFSAPVDLENFWIRQRFNNPYRKSWNFGGTDYLKFDYYQHTGLDFAPIDVELREREDAELRGLNVYAIDDGKIAKVQLNDGNDRGLGNTIIIEHEIDNKKIYSLYAHLSFIKPILKEGDIIKRGEIIGEVGNSGYGCQNYWRIGPDGCQSQAPFDTHLHFEIKKAPVLENPRNGGPYYGYTPDYPEKYGYLNPTEFLFEKRSLSY